MFSKPDIQKIDYNGEKLLIFKPNTITYAVEENSSLGNRIKNAQMGIVFHTKYTGPLNNLTKSPNVHVDEFNQTKEVFVDDARFKDVTGTATLTNDEQVSITTNLKKIQSAGKTINWSDLTAVTYADLNTFINSLIRQGRFVDDPDKNFEQFLAWYSDNKDKEIAKLTTDRGKLKKTETKNKNIENLNKNKLSIVNIFYITKLIAEVKNIFILKYNTAIKSKQFIAQPDGTLKVTQPEGYVAVDHEGNMIKLVDRLEFSKANFAIPKELKFK